MGDVLENEMLGDALGLLYLIFQIRIPPIRRITALKTRRPIFSYHMPSCGIGDLVQSLLTQI